MNACRFLWVLPMFVFVFTSFGQTVSTVKVGSQEWMTENLSTSTFRNGDAIPLARTDEEWEKAGTAGKPAWCYYENDSENGKTYGKLYNWFAVNDPRGLAPAGWRVPTDKEWTEMIKQLGGEAVAGKKLKASSGWPENTNGSNTSGLTVLPGGCRHANGMYYGIENLAYFWTSTQSNTVNGWYRTISRDFDKVHRHGSLKKASGFSVRCIKD